MHLARRWWFGVMGLVLALMLGSTGKARGQTASAPGEAIVAIRRGGFDGGEEQLADDSGLGRVPFPGLFRIKPRSML